jgi:MFS family permease
MSRRGWINSTILGIGAASLFSDIGHEMATAALPGLLASIGASSAALGLIEGCADGFSSFAKLYSGLYGDRLERRKPLAVVGYFLTASGMASFAFATRSWHVLIGRVGGWVGRGARGPVRNVLLTEATTPETYGRAFGLERAMDSAGAVIGPALALLLVSRVPLRTLFLLTFIPGMIAALLIWFMVEEKPHAPSKRAQSVWAHVADLPAHFRRYLAGVAFAGAGDFSKTLLILWAAQAWSAQYGLLHAARLAMLFYVGYNAIYTFSCYASGLLADRFPKNHVLAGGYALAAIPAAFLLLPGDSLAKFALVFGFSGLYMGVWETVENSTAATMLPAESRGVGFGALASVNGVGDMISSAAVGALWVLSPAGAMAFVIATSLTGSALIATL